jgi:predicted amidohydrolase YtcJ
MTQEHPITPPLELVQQWVNDFAPKGMMAIATQAARWGADEELEACRLWVSENESIYDAGELVECRRPKPKTLKEMKERGMKALLECYAYIPDDLYYEIKKTIESLPDES